MSTASNWRNEVFWMFQGLFLLGFVLFSSVIFLEYSQGEMGLFEAVENLAIVIFYFILASAGAKKGVDLLINSYEVLEEHPGVLKINFYSSVLFVAANISIVILSGLFIAADYLVIGVIFGLIAFTLLLLSIGLFSSVSTGAVALYFYEDLSPSRAVSKSLKLSPRYLMIGVYKYLILNVDGIIGRKLLSFTDLPYKLIKTGANTWLSYATIIAAVENCSAIKAVIKSLKLSIEEPEKTTFLSLGITAVLIAAGVFLIVPIIIYILLLALLYDTISTGIALVISSIPFLVGVTAYTYLGSVASTSQEIALLTLYSEEQGYI